MQSACLVSDMESFKAANPGCTIEDFVRWYSPRDWIEEDESTKENPIGMNRLKMNVGTSCNLSFLNIIYMKSESKAFTKKIKKELKYLQYIRYFVII